MYHVCSRGQRSHVSCDVTSTTKPRTMSTMKGGSSGAMPDGQTQPLNEEETRGHGTSIMVVGTGNKMMLRDVGRGHDQDGDDSSSESDDDQAAGDHQHLIPRQNPTLGNLLRMACSKKPLKIGCCLLLLIITICIVSLVAATTTTYILLHRSSSPFSVITTFNSTVVIPLSKFVESFSITSTRDAVDYSCTLATVTLPCSALNRSYSRNQSVDDISNDAGNLYLYLLKGSVMHFRFNSDSNCPSYTLWVFRDQQRESTILCTSLNEQKFKGKCKTFKESGTFDYSVPSDAYYFYTGYGCESGRPKLLLTSIDYYWYDFTQYVNYSGVQTVYIPQRQHREITAALSFSLARMCTLIYTPNKYDCRAGHSFKSLVDISQIHLHPVIWVLCIVPIGLISLVVSAGALFLYTAFLIKAAKKERRYHQPEA